MYEQVEIHTICLIYRFEMKPSLLSFFLLFAFGGNLTNSGPLTICPTRETIKTMKFSLLVLVFK